MVPDEYQQDPTKYAYIAAHGETAYFMTDDGGGLEYRTTPPTANGRALDSWDRDLARFRAHRTAR